MNVTAIKCYCETNPDFAGAWNASDIKEELKDLGDIPENEWMDYLFSHLFGDVKDWTPEIENAVSNNSVHEIGLTLDGHKVTIKKFYHTEF